MSVFSRRAKEINKTPISINGIRNELRESKISSLERERLGIVEELEQVAKRYAKLTGNKRVRRRRGRVGAAPNDWQKSYL